MNTIVHILLSILLVLQIILMIFLIFTDVKRYKADKKFWKDQEQISAEFLKRAREFTPVEISVNENACIEEGSDDEKSE